MGDEEIKRWLAENLPPDTGARQIDAKAVLAWMERNPDASREELQQVLMAPDHNLGELTED